ncbi:MAG: TlpA family protein disulfide reductase [Rubrivivax sp.]|nr:TlpA family protein disulfide reductase [Rubrivivax sp.]
MTVKRRNALLAATGLAAAAAGAGWQAWRTRGAAPAPADASAAPWLWPLQFERPEGGLLAMASLRGRPLLINFWGTWCPPCIKEMPELDAFARRFAPAGWQVLGLAVDKAQAVRDYLLRSPVSYTIAMAGFEGTELARTLGNTQAGLPFTVMLDGSGAIVQRKSGATTLAELAAWAGNS